MPTYRPPEERLDRARVALDNAQTDPALQDGLAAFGYDAARLQEGQGLLAAAQGAQEAHAAEYGDQYAATDELRAARETAETTYMRHVKVARVAFSEDRDARSALMLDGRRKRPLGAWLRQAHTFYQNALASEDLLAGLARFGITAEDLQAAQAQLDTLETADTRQEKEKGEAQRATQQRDEAVDALDAYMSDFRNIARVAFEEDPQQLEKLRISAPSA